MSDESPRYIDHELIAAIEEFIAANPPMTASAFGTKSVNDPALVADLKAGRELRRATKERILAFIGAPKETVSTQPQNDLSGSNVSLKQSSDVSRTSTTSEAAE